MKWPDYFVNKTISGDCLDVMKYIPDHSIDLILTDPPYFCPGVHYQTRTKFSRRVADIGILESFVKIAFKEFARIIKSTGSIYMFCNGESYPLFFYHLYPFCRKIRVLVWDKRVSHVGYTWRHQHELILFGEMGETKAVPTGDGDILRCRVVPVLEREHAAQKPVELFEKIILKSTESGMIVFDPFAGVGTTAISATNTGRRYICIDISEEYCKSAESHISDETAQLGFAF